MNPFGIAGSWRVDPDNRQNRGNGLVTSYKLSPEEIEHIFSQAQAPKKAKESKSIMKLDIDVTKLLEVCRVHGTGKEAHKAVAETFGISEKQAENQIYLKKIRRLLTAEKKPLIPATVPNTAMAGDEKEDPKVSSILNESIKIEPTLSVEDALLEQIKTIVNENKQMRALDEENKALKSMISAIHDKLQEIMDEIRKGGKIE